MVCRLRRSVLEGETLRRKRQSLLRISAVASFACAGFRSAGRRLDRRQDRRKEIPCIGCRTNAVCGGTRFTVTPFNTIPNFNFWSGQLNSSRRGKMPPFGSNCTSVTWAEQISLPVASSSNK